tara:strand:+ start:1949 stop:2452 length:504 start_codon:yes stop_codon:yes gene_type:complete
MEIISFLTDPFIATNIILVVLVIYIYILTKNKILGKDFFHFGPGTSPENTVKFINRKVDTWNMVWLVWIIGFTTTLLQKYYWTTISDYIYLKVRNDNVKNIDCNKSKLKYVIFFKIIISTILSILGFFTYLTAQLQFIIPGVLTSILIYLPLEISKLNKKKIIKKNK